MNKLATLATTGALMLAICINGTAQTSANSSQEKPSPTATAETCAGADEVIARLIREGKSGRELIASLEDEITKRERELELEKQNSASIAKSYARAENELAGLRIAVDALKQAFAAQKQATDTAIEQRDQERTKRKKAEKREIVSHVVTFFVVLSRLL